MLASELDFALPPELIAQAPACPRESAKLLHLSRKTGALQHLTIADLPELLRPDDLLIFNDTRVLRARLHGHKLLEDSQAGARVEALLLREIETNLWEVLLKPSARLKVGQRIEFGAANVTATALLLERNAQSWRIRFENPGGDIRDLLSQLGEVPLPPYIKQTLRDDEDYQTIFARQNQNLDAAAAPTAGLHFTPQLLEKLEARGIRTAFVTLAVGIGTFRPVQTETLEAHVMHSEEFEVPDLTADLIAEQKRRGRRVVAVGTTSMRVLETAADASGNVQRGRNSSQLFIRPGFRFRCADALLTNFHLPRSTLLAMVAAFVEQESPLPGLPQIFYAYNEAIARRYRFFSFGDAMLIE